MSRALEGYDLLFQGRLESPDREGYPTLRLIAQGAVGEEPMRSEAGRPLVRRRGGPAAHLH